MTYTSVGLRGVEPLTSRLSGRPYTKQTRQHRQPFYSCKSAVGSDVAPDHGGAVAIEAEQNGAFADRGAVS